MDDDAPIDSDEDLSDIDVGDDDHSARGADSMIASGDMDKPDMGAMRSDIMNKMKKSDSPEDMEQP